MIEIIGKVIHGDHYGSKIGYPTVNLDRRQYNRKNLNVKFGVWAGEAKLKVKSGSNFAKATSDKKLKVYRGAIVIGPIDKTGKPKIEAHLLSFKGNLYGKKITLALIKYLRPFKKFKNEQELKLQIKKDINKIKFLNLK